MATTHPLLPTKFTRKDTHLPASLWACSR